MSRKIVSRSRIDGSVFEKEMKLAVLDFQLWYAAAVLLAYLVFSSKRDWGWRKRLLHVALLLYLCALIKVTFFPIPIAEEFALAGDPSRFYSFVPFYSTMLLVHGAMQMQWAGTLIRLVGGNFILLMPLAVLVPMIWKGSQSLLRITVTGLLISCSIEALQFLIGAAIGWPYRFVDVDDVMLNTAGCMVAYGGFVLLRPRR